MRLPVGVKVLAFVVAIIGTFSPDRTHGRFTRACRDGRLSGMQGLFPLSPFSIVMTQYASPLCMRHHGSRSASSCFPFSIACVALSALWSPMLY